MISSTAIAELSYRMSNVRKSSDALAQPVAADSDNSTLNIDHLTFPLPPPGEPS
jgi:hypothetical protein